MKTRNFIKNSLIALIPISLGLGFLFGVSNLQAEGVEAYPGVALPTTIDLNDTADNDIRAYYSNLNSLSSAERKGENLLKNLKPILSNGQKYYNYDSGDLVWKMYEITDRDWDKSPATAITYGSYDKITNKITNYVYGSNSAPKNDPYVRAYYMDRTQENVVKAWGNHKQDATGINREHLWAKAQGFDGSSGAEAGARGDPMHLVAANGYANNIHSNYYYGYVDTTRDFDDVNKTYSTLGHNLRGYSATFPSYKGSVFEPQDCDKGDIARAIFYMAARYNNIAGKTSSQETFNSDNPNLLLTDDLSKWKSSGYTSDATNPGYYGLVTDLLEWNRIDPPDEYEIHRNNLLYTNFTNNRNPFIDFPEWADICWGKSTSSADPTTDKINGGSEEKVLESIEITTAPSKVNYMEGDVFDPSDMVVIAHYSDESESVAKNYTWSPSGELTTSDTTVTISYGGKEATVNISVVQASTKIKYFAPVSGTNFVSGDYLITSGDDEYVWKDGNSGSGHSEAITLDTAGNIPYSSSLEGYLLTINKEAGSIKRPDGKYIGANTDATGLKASDSVISNTFAMTGKAFDAQSSGTHLRYNPNNGSPIFNYYKSTSYTNYNDVHLFKYVEADPVHPTSISISPNSVELVINSTRALKATVLPSNCTYSSVTWSSDDEDVAVVDQKGVVTAVGPGEATIVATSKDPSATDVYGVCNVTVPEPVVLNRIELSGTYKTEFNKGDAFSNDGIVVTAYYKQGAVDSYSEVVTEDTEFSGFDSSKTGDCYVTASYNGVTAKYKVTITEAPVEENVVDFVMDSFGFANAQQIGSIGKDNYSITFGGTGTKAAYYNTGKSVRCYPGNTFTISGPKKIVEVSFTFGTDDHSNPISSSDGLADNATGHWLNSNGSNNVVFSIEGSGYHRKIAEIKVKYDPNKDVDSTLTSISLSGTYQTEFYQGDDFSAEGLVVTAHYNIGSDKKIALNDENLSISGYDKDTLGTQTITVAYEENSVEKSATYGVKVIKVIPDSLEITTDPSKTTYYVGDLLDTDGIEAVVTYNNEDTLDVDEDDLTFSHSKLTVAGTYDVTASYTEGETSVSDTFEITVNKVELSSIAIKTNPSKTTYYTGQSFDSTGLSIEATYNNSTKKTVTSGFTCSGFNSSKAAESLPITVSYTEDGVTKTTTFNVVVIKSEFASLTLSGEYKTSFLYDTDFSSQGLKATVAYSSGATKDVSSDVTVSGYNMKQIGEQTVTVTYKEGEDSISTSYQITVIAITPKSLTLSGSYKTVFEYDEEFTSEGLVVQATYDNGKTYEVEPTNISGYNKKQSGEQTITVTYEENGATISATYKVVVKDVKLTSITLSGDYKTEFEFGSPFSSQGIIVTAHYSDGSSKQVTPRTIKGYNGNIVGSQTITVTYIENGVSVSTTYVVTVKPKETPAPQPDPEPKPDEPSNNNTPIIIGAAAGGAVAVGGAATGIGIALSKKRKLRGK